MRTRASRRAHPATLAPEQTDSELRPGDADALDPLDKLDDTLARPTLVPDSYFKRDAGEPRQGATPLQGAHPGGDGGEQYPCSRRR